MKVISKYIYGVLLILGLLVAGEGEVWGTSYAKLTLSSSPSGGGKVYIGEKEGQETTEGSLNIESSTLSGSVTFYIKAVPNDGYHFNIWKSDDNVTIGKKYYLSTNVKATSGATEGSTKSYTVIGYFLENYYAKMNVQKTTGSSGNITVDGNNGYKNVPKSDSTIVFNLSAPSPNTGYYFSGWTGSNITFGTASSLSTTATVSPSATGGKSNATTYSATANYAPYYYAKLNVSATTGASGSPTGGGTNQVTTSGGSITFNNLTAKAASPGYKFTGWSGSGITFSAQKSLTTNATVSASTTATGTASYTATANYKPTYVVHFHPHNEMETGHSVTGSMADATFACEVDETLPANTFVNTITTTFDGDGGQLKNTSGTFVNSYTVTQTATFREWTDSANFNPRTPKKTYSDKGTINRSGLTELNLYACWNNKGVTYPEGKRGDRTLTKFDNGKTTGQTSWPSYSYTIKALWSDPFYAAMTATNTTGASGTPTVDQAKKSSDYKGSNSGTATFALTAKAASTGYHFTGWTGTGISFSAPSSLTTNATVAVSSTAGESNATSYTATANYVQNTYYAALTATSGGNGTVTVTQSPKSTTTQSGDIVFDITITPDSGYHLNELKFTTGTGTISGNKVTVKASSNYAVDGDNKAAQYAIKATFAENHFYAKLTTAVSTAGTGNTGTAQVSADGGTTYAGNATKSASTSGGNVTFHIKATPNTGYQFKGWSETNGSTSYKSTTAETDYTVKGHTTEGQTQAYNLYAVFNHGTYKVHFVANGGTGSMSDQTFTHGTAQNLTQNSFVNNFTVTYDVQGGTAISPETKSRFNGWSYNSTTYADKASVNLTVAHNSTLNFTAQWKSSVDFTLPTPTKKAADGTTYAFLGWFDAATGGNKVGDAGATVSISSTRTLYAHWQDYNILIKASWSSVSTGDKAVFSVTRSGNPAITYYISVPIGGSTASKTLKDVVPGTWTVTPVTQWTWNYNNPAAQSKTLTAGTNTFDFTFTSKGSTKKHDEKSGTVTP